jgi:hypothetical protein
MTTIGYHLGTCRARRRSGAPHVREGVALLAGLGLLSGCLGDPPPDPSVQPLEIVAAEPDSDAGPCMLPVVPADS